MNTVTLRRPVRDFASRWHTPGEVARWLSACARADFDATLVISVEYPDGSRGAVIPEDIDE